MTVDMGLRNLLEKTKDRFKKHKHASSDAGDLGLTVDDPTVPPRRRSLASQRKDAAATFPELPTSNDTKKRSRTDRLLSALRKNKSLKSKPLVGTPMISNFPSTITRRTPALSIIVETEVVCEDEDTSTDVQDIEDIALKQVVSPKPPYEQDGEEHDEHRGDQNEEEADTMKEASSTVNAVDHQLVLASFFDAKLLQELNIISNLPHVSDVLPARFYEAKDDITSGVLVERATSLYQKKSCPAYPPRLQQLDTQTGALVLYHPKPLRRDSHEVRQAVKELSEQPEATQSWTLEKYLGTEYNADSIPDLGTVVSDNEASETSHEPDEAPNLDDGEASDSSSIHSSLSIAEEPISVWHPDTPAIDDHDREILRLRAEHRAEVAKLKKQNRENIDVFANDLAEQKEKTVRANQRAVRSLKQLNASRKERQKLGERQPVDLLHSRIADLEAQVAKDDADVNYLLDAGRKLQTSLGEANVNLEAIQRNRDTIWNDYQVLHQHSKRQEDLLDDLRDDLKALRHQMHLAVGEKGAALAGQMQLGRRVEKLQVINRALLNERGDSYAKVPLGTEQPGQLRPDQLRDAEQALLTSQSEHKKASERAVSLLTELNTTRNALDEATGEVKALKGDNRHLKYALGRIANLGRANQEMFDMMENPFLDGANDELFNASITAENEKNGLAKLINDGVQKRTKLQQSLEQKQKEKDSMTEEYEQKMEEMEKEKDSLQNENLGQAMEIRDLKKIAVLYRHARKDNSSLLEDVNALRAQLAVRAFDHDAIVLWNDANRQLADAMVQVQQLEVVVYDQQMMLQKKDADIALSEDTQQRRYEYPRSLLLARDRYFAVVQAFLHRFQDQLAKHGPLVVDVTGCLLLLNDEEVREFMQFPEQLVQSGDLNLGGEVVTLPSDRIWMRVVYDEDRVKGAAQAANVHPEALEQMMSAVEAEALKRRQNDLAEARSGQYVEEERRKRDDQSWETYKQEQYSAYDQDREKVREEAAKDNIEVAAVLDKVRQRPDWEHIDPNVADAAEEEWETASNRSDYEDDYGEPEVSSTTLVNEEQPNSFQVPADLGKRNQLQAYFRANLGRELVTC